VCFAGLITNGQLNLWEQAGIESSVQSLLGRAKRIHYSLPLLLLLARLIRPIPQPYHIPSQNSTCLAMVWSLISRRIRLDDTIVVEVV
jgi:hypothetical protein